MSSCRKSAASLALVLLAAFGSAAWAQASGSTAYPGIGRAATPKEVQAWDIDVRPDFKGLPPGSGSVAKGMEVWEAKCASCHGIFGESNEIFSPLVGGTTKEDVKTGRVARLNDRSFPGRTTLMKVPTVSTLWDYINRAMPWNTPKSLTVEEVYAVTAYLLNMGEVLPESFVLSDKNIAQVQALLPNRNGMSTDHHLWPGKSMGNAKPDVMAQACMSNCEAEPRLASFLPDFARNAHGNLAEQNRLVGAQRGADTTRPPGAAPAAVRLAVVAPAATGGNAAAVALAGKYTCTACHGMENKIVGPGFAEIAKKHAGRADAEAYLAEKIRNGGQGVWGPIPMPAQTLPEADARALAQWIAAGARK
jgi:cytochrome c